MTLPHSRYPAGREYAAIYTDSSCVNHAFDHSTRL
jgi:hypothetical protein